MEGIQCSLASKFSTSLLKLEKELQSDMNIVLEQIDIHWFYKSRLIAIYDGDMNTGCFYAFTIFWQKKNKIEGM